MPSNNNRLEIKGAKILSGPYRNFTGKETEYNAKGRRNFCVIVSEPDDLAALQSMGVNIKCRQPKDDQDDPLYYFKVNVWLHDNPEEQSKDSNIRKVTVDKDGKVTSNVKLDFESVVCLDYADIEYVDIKIYTTHWERAGREGMSVNLSSMYAIVNEDEFDSRYQMESEEIPFD